MKEGGGEVGESEGKENEREGEGEWRQEKREDRGDGDRGRWKEATLIKKGGEQ